MRIKDIRKRLGMSIREVTELLDIPYRTWQHWEGGTRKVSTWVEKLILFRLEYELGEREKEK